MKVDLRFERSCRANRLVDKRKAERIEKGQIVIELRNIVRKLSIEKARVLLGVARVAND